MDSAKKTAIVGFGKMGLLHGALVSASEELELVAICEKTAFTRNSIKSVMKNVNFYSDYRKMMDKEQLDAIVITTPTFNHAEVAKYAAQKGIAVFCEKPLAINGDEAAGIADLFEEKGVPSLVGFSNRFFPTIAKGKELLDSGELGTIRSIKSEMYIGDVFKDNSGWRYDPKMSGGGALIDFGIHMLDLLVWYFGRVKEVKGWTKSIYSRQVEDEAGSDIYFENGLEAQFITSWSRSEYRKSSPIITVEGEKGKLVVTEQTIDMEIDGKQEHLTFPDLYKGDYIDVAGINYTLEMKTFIAEIQGQHCGLDVKQGAYIQKIVDAIYRSAETGNREEVR